MSEPIAPPPPPYTPKKIVAEQSPIGIKCDLDLTEELAHLIELERSQNMIDKEVLRLFHPVKPVLQEGPTCGMAALAMGLENKSLTLKNLQKIAIENNWSKMGEMYSCHWMMKLASIAGATPRLISNGIQNHLECISHCLSEGGFLLVPYDKDKDNSPGLFLGNSAHWAIIFGLLVFETDLVMPIFPVNPCKCLKISNTNGKLYNLIGNDRQIRIQDKILSFSPDGCDSSSSVVPYVCALQGKSCHLQLWPFYQLAQSNLNLCTEGDSRKGKVIIPPGGVEVGLSGQAVLLLPH